jgi:hypothetical protein
MNPGNPQATHYYGWVAAACAALALWALYRFLVSLRRDRLVSDTPLVKIRSAAQGYVKLFGRTLAAGDTALCAPLSRRPCVWWRYEVEQKVRGPRGETNWESIDSGSSVDLFVLADADAQCLVGPVNAEITPTTHTVWYGAEAKPCAPPASPGLWQSGDYRYTESLLDVGARLSVVGELRSHSEPGDNNAAAAELLKQWKQDQPALLARFDRNHDGHIDAAEWDAVRQEALKTSQAQSLKSPITRMRVISQPTNGEPFLIAAMDDAHLARREKRHAALFLCLGLCCVIACAWSLDHGRELDAMFGGPSRGRGDSMGLWLLWVIFVGAAAGGWRLFKRSA